MSKLFAAIAGIFLAFGAAPALAQTEDELAQKVINAPLPASLQVYGLPTPPVVIRDKTVLGGRALHVKVPGALPDVWRISLQSAITQPIKKGDTIVLAFWAKASGLAEGTTAKIASAQVQLNKEPYTTMFGQPVDVTGEWFFHQVQGKADRDYAAGELGASLQLATGKYVIDFGPFFILDMNR